MLFTQSKGTKHKFRSNKKENEYAQNEIGNKIIKFYQTQQVCEFKYLGTVIEENANMEIEIDDKIS